MGKLSYLGHKLMLKLPPEMAHNIGSSFMRNGVGAPGRYANEDSMIKLFGWDIDNPLGLAAGFDKNGYLVNSVRDYGFGWIEIGSITYEGGNGNKKPRLFRVDAEDGKVGLLNRMGLNGDPAESVVCRLINAQNPFAINIAKTHNPEIMGEKAIEDMVKTYEIVKSLGDKPLYIAWNLSCPNTAEGKTFEDPVALAELDSALMDRGKTLPWVYKFSPNLSLDKLISLIDVVNDHADGYIGANARPHEHSICGKGGLSGPDVKNDAVLTTARIRGYVGDEKVLMGLGGIFDGKDAFDFWNAGADVFQALTGFVYKGSRFAHDVLNEFIDLSLEEEVWAE